ncbi:hypothetical protein [Pseudozobellia sp. WGM2]|uniref:hypothetical protein n=1 Tax=Pseudozobellia sp. WGM2 TaxID=2787625 RepID=UPI001AE099D3|nr:hypothetical protein [Pseudozobellia sp. WGM2]
MKQSRFVLIFVTLLLSLFLISCEEESLSAFDDLQPDIVAPTIDIIDFSPLIETETEIKFSIKDSSNVSTSILFNGKSILESDNRELVVKIDPFEYQIGEGLLEVISVDAEGNEKRKNFKIEIKHLLFKVPFENIRYPNFHDSYILLNNSEGKLLEYKKVEGESDISFYSDGPFLGEEFTATLFLVPKQKTSTVIYRLYSFGNITHGTILKTKYEIEQLENYNFQEDKIVSKNVELNFSLEAPIYSNATGYYLNRSSDSAYRLDYSENIDDTFFCLSAMPFEGRIKDDYKFLIIDDLNKVNYDENDFKKPESFYKVDLPEIIRNGTHEGWFSQSIIGYRNESDYEERIGHGLTSYGSSINIFQDDFYVPVFDEFDIYEMHLSACDRENYQMSRKQWGLEYKDFPNMDLFSNNDSVFTTGTYNHILFNFSSFGSDFKSMMQWIFYFEPSDKIEVPYYDFELPEELKDLLADDNLTTNPRSESNQTSISVKLVHTKEEWNYKKLMFEFSNHYESRGEWFVLEHYLETNGESDKYPFDKIQEYDPYRQFPDSRF